QAGGQPVAGSLSLTQSGDSAALTGALELGRLDAAGLLALLGGPAALIETDAGDWPDGPLELGAETRPTSGRVAVSTQEIGIGKAAITDATFDVDWDGTAVRLRELEGRLGGGDLTLDLAICCAGPLQDKQVSGRMAMQGVTLDALAPAAVAEALQGTLTASGRFSGTGDSVSRVVAAMTGEGSYTIDDLVIAGIDPTAFAAIDSLESIMELDREELSEIIRERLDGGSLEATELAGGFTIAGGVFRSPNVAIEGAEARLFGSTTVQLDTF